MPPQVYTITWKSFCLCCYFSFCFTGCHILANCVQYGRRYRPLRWWTCRSSTPKIEFRSHTKLSDRREFQQGWFSTYWVFNIRLSYQSAQRKGSSLYNFSPILTTDNFTPFDRSRRKVCQDRREVVTIGNCRNILISYIAYTVFDQQFKNNGMWV